LHRSIIGKDDIELG